jgi:hypothetical protein
MLSEKVEKPSLISDRLSSQKTGSERPRNKTKRHLNRHLRAINGKGIATDSQGVDGRAQADWSFVARSLDGGRGSDQSVSSLPPPAKSTYPRRNELARWQEWTSCQTARTRAAMAQRLLADRCSGYFLYPFLSEAYIEKGWNVFPMPHCQ